MMMISDASVGGNAIMTCYESIGYITALMLRAAQDQDWETLIDGSSPLAMTRRASHPSNRGASKRSSAKCWPTMPRFACSRNRGSINSIACSATPIAKAGSPPPT